MYADDLILMYGIESDDSDLCRARTGTVRLAMLLNLVWLGAVWYLPGGTGEHVLVTEVRAPGTKRHILC